MSHQDAFFFLICKLNMLICKLKMELKWQVNIYNFTFFVFLLFVLGLYSLSLLPAARKGLKRRKHGFSHISASEFNTVTLK